MKVNLRKRVETVYVARCQHACAKDRDGNDVIPFGNLWERKDSSDALIIVEELALKTYELKGETRRYHTWMEEVTRYDDGSEECVMVREYNRPAEPETAPQSGSTPCACRDCMDVAMSGDWTRPEVCEECREAGCLNYTHRPNLDFEGGPGFGCQRDDAYEG